ncbi:cupin domain-containing protein [Rhodococcus opacus]|uniref:cupin domain-containing protein n=1 Tax=Rhodococcus opacus TaxID=37919 RepID=UPI00146B0D43|nr:cupin domain-containing protein [Rhodococcus opacus]MDV7088965.1 cupin domain-containing protein [Rhodococcus opacus]WKN60251.1 cupin domain-containing protein [Rhodococcus opacus]
MAGEHFEARARRIVVGLDEDGRSKFVSDGMTDTRHVTDAFTRNVIWQATEVPTPVMAESGLPETAPIEPPPGGYHYIVTTFPPDSEWDYEAGYAKALTEADAPNSFTGNDIPGMHTTDTVDIVTVISGEIWALVETGETLLKQGDSLVQRGTKHAWRNRSDAPCTIAAVMVSVVR